MKYIARIKALKPNQFKSLTDRVSKIEQIPFKDMLLTCPFIKNEGYWNLYTFCKSEIGGSQNFLNKLFSKIIWARQNQNQ